MRKITLFLLVLALLIPCIGCNDETDTPADDNSAWEFPLDEQLSPESAGRVYREAWAKTHAHTERDYTVTLSLTDDNTLYDYTSFVEEHRVYTGIGSDSMAVSVNGSMIDYTGDVYPFLFFYKDGQAYTNNYDANTFYKAPCAPAELETLLGYDYVLDSKGDYTAYSGRRNADGTYTIYYSAPDSTLFADLRVRMGSYEPTSVSPDAISGVCIIMEDGYVSSDILTVKGTYLTYNDDVYERTLVYDFKENTSATTFNPLAIPSHINAVSVDSLTAVHHLNQAYAPLDDAEALAVDIHYTVDASLQKKTAMLTSDISLRRQTIDNKLHATMTSSASLTEGDKVIQSQSNSEVYKDGLVSVDRDGEKEDYSVTESTYRSAFSGYYDFYSGTLNQLTAASVAEKDDTLVINYTYNDDMAFTLADSALVEIFGEDMQGLVYEDEDLVLEVQSGTLIIQKSDKALLSHTFNIKGDFPTSEGTLTLDFTFDLSVGGSTNEKLAPMMVTANDSAES